MGFANPVARHLWQRIYSGPHPSIPYGTPPNSHGLPTLTVRDSQFAADTPHSINTAHQRQRKAPPLPVPLGTGRRHGRHKQARRQGDAIPPRDEAGDAAAGHPVDIAVAVAV